MANFDIHDLLSFSIADGYDRGPARWFNFNGRYQAFAVPGEPAHPPQLIIELGPFTPALAGCEVLDGEYYIKPDYLYHREHSGKLGGAWRFEASGLEEGPVRLRIEANLTGLPFVPGRIIDFFIQYVLVRAGYSLFHASAVAAGERAVVYSGRGGGGKTTLALAGVEQRRLKYLGDNFIICKEGQLFSFCSDLNLFGYNVRPEVWARLTPGEQRKFRAYNLLYRASAGYIKIFTPVSPLRVFPQALQDTAQLAVFNSLLTGPHFDYRPLDRAVVLARTVSNQKLEFFPFLRHIESYGCVVPDSKLARFWQLYADLLQRNLPEAVDYRQITVPEKLDPALVRQILGRAFPEEQVIP